MRRPERERGSVSVLAVVAIVFAGVLMFGLARLGSAARDSARADTAADAAALAAAGMLARGGDASAAATAAAESATHNGGQLKRCSCSGTRPTVDVRVGDATGHARAEIRFECFADPEHC